MLCPDTFATEARPSRSVPRYVALADAIQSRIANGEFPEGSQLPPERDMARDNGVAYLTARQAIGLLVKKGIVDRRHGHGTFVKSVCQKELIALLCGPDLHQEMGHFYRAMVRAVELEGARQNFTFRIYDHLTDESGEPQPDEVPMLRSLRADLANYNFSGVIELTPGRQGINRFSESIPVPNVVFEGGHPLSDIDFDYRDFGKVAVKHLIGKNVHKIQILRFFAKSAMTTSPVIEGAFDAVAEAGLSQLQVRVTDLPLDVKNFEKSIHASTLEMIRSWQSPGGNPPEGLIVTDDIAMRAVALALIQSGFYAANRLEIICQATESIDHHYGLPVSRYEFQASKAARVLIDALKAKISGQSRPHRPVLIDGIVKSDVL